MREYYRDEKLTIYLGDCREVLPSIAPVDAIITDPPYAETSLKWDRWPDGWPTLCATLANSLWCFGSMRMFLDRRDEFASWTMAQDLVWEKHNGSCSFADRFRRVHECAVHYYRGPWEQVYKRPVKTHDATKRALRRKDKPQHWGGIGEAYYASEDGGPRLMRSVIYCRSCHGQAVHPTQKPEGIIRPLVEYSVPPGGVVLDPFMGSGTTLRVALDMGCRAIGIETDEQHCETAAKRLAQAALAL